MYLCMQMHLQVGVWQDSAGHATTSGGALGALPGYFLARRKARKLAAETVPQAVQTAA